jgi:rare lipoprotein A
VKARTCCVLALATGLPFSSWVSGAGADDGWCGEAAWFEGGGLTASGEMNEAGALSAAHPSLSFGTRVKVDNLGNGRSVIVRINDRASFARDRVILVSRAAAEELGMIHDGTARVRLGVVVGDQARTGRCAGDDGIVEEAAPEPPATDAIAASEPPEGSVAHEAIAARFAVAFQPETWQEAELAKAIAAFAPRLGGSAGSGRPPAAIPWPALDGMTPIRLTPTLIAYAWSSELSLPRPAGFERAAATTRLSQLMQ